MDVLKSEFVFFCYSFTKGNSITSLFLRVEKLDKYIYSLSICLLFLPRLLSPFSLYDKNGELFFLFPLCIYLRETSGKKYNCSYDIAILAINLLDRCNIFADRTVYGLLVKTFLSHSKFIYFKLTRSSWLIRIDLRTKLSCRSSRTRCKNLYV